MFGPYPDTLPELLEVLEYVYKHDWDKSANADKLRACIEFLLRLLHK